MVGMAFMYAQVKKGLDVERAWCNTREVLILETTSILVLCSGSYARYKNETVFSHL